MSLLHINLRLLGLSAAVAGAGFLWAIYRHRQRKEAKRPWKRIPGALPFIGHAHFIPNIKIVIKVLENWADQYGKDVGCYEIQLGLDTYVIVTNGDRALELFQRRPFVVQRSTQINEGANSIGATGVFSAEGDQWQQEHKLMGAALNDRNVEDYMIVFKVMANRLVQKWKQEDEVVVNQDLASIAADSITNVGLGVDYDFLNNPSNQVARDIQVSMFAFVSRGLSSVPYWRIPFLGQFLDGCGAAINRLKRLVGRAVEAHAANPDAKKQTFLHKIHSVMESEHDNIQHDRMVGNVLTLFIAGSDTTSKTLTSALYVLAQDREMQSELWEEVSGMDIQTASMRDLFSGLPRLKSFLHEVHRIYGVAFSFLRSAKDIPFCGTTLPVNSNILVLMRYITTARHLPHPGVPEGPSKSPPWEFCHRRWLEQDGNGSWCCPSPSFRDMGFLPFGHGVRSCIGRTYAEALSLLVLVALLQNFEWMLAPNHPDLEIVSDVTMVPDGDVRLSMKPRRK